LEHTSDSDNQIIQIFNPSGEKLPVSPNNLNLLLSKVEAGERVSFGMLELVYVDEDEIIRINKEHLKKDYITDIITFRYDEDAQDKHIEGTLYCCATRIMEQAIEFGASPEHEFYRVFIHGLLHLAGYDDASKSEKNQMTDRENHYLSTLQ
jgi:probable rRNA maturation factor